MKKWLKGVMGVVAFAGIALQFTNPSRENPPVAPGHDALAGQTPPPAVAALLTDCCYDCHSFQTRWPWYSHLAPVSRLVARDVNAARAALNFSDWPHGDAARERKRWRRVAEEVENGEMPPGKYLLIHRQARLV
jgi:hypothetical protein